MITIKFNINLVNKEDRDFILNKQKEYSYAFRKLYTNFNQIDNREYLNKLKEKFDLSDWELKCLFIDVKSKVNQILTQKNKLSNDIISITKEIEKYKNSKETRRLFKLNKKLEYKNKHLSKDITFGGLSLLKKLSFLNNDKINNKDEINKIKTEYMNKRILPINYVGSLGDNNSNRYFDFDFINNKIVYKPTRDNHIEINYKITNNYKKYLLKLQKIKNNKILPISVKLTTDYMCISFDEELLTNYSFNKKRYFEEIKTVSKENKELRKEIYLKYINEQKERKFKNKILNRYCSIDLNPEYIGVSILDKKGDDDFKIVDNFAIDLSALLKKSNKSSDDIDSIYINNKRKYEIGVIYKYLFRKINHYKCSHFVIEDLNFKSDNINKNNNESNRKIKNVWNLDFQKNLIDKHCKINGIEKVVVNSCYSSFIGNIMYNYFDPINDSIEIGRRGIFKYIKDNNFYPKLTSTIIDTVEKRFPDVQSVKDCLNWVSLYKLIKETKVKYRWQLNDINFNCFSRFNKKCNWNLIRFN